MCKRIMKITSPSTSIVVLKCASGGFCSAWASTI